LAHVAKRKPARCHTWPEESEGEEVGRIISARKATAHERRAYEEVNF
jgi:hypothetical protein